MSDCCNCSTRWEIEETRWTVYGYGLSDGAQYLGAKMNIVDPNTPPVGCAPGAWKFIGEKKKQKLNNKTRSQTMNVNKINFDKDERVFFNENIPKKALKYFQRPRNNKTIKRMWNGCQLKMLKIMF